MASSRCRTLWVAGLALSGAVPRLARAQRPHDRPLTASEVTAFPPAASSANAVRTVRGRVLRPGPDSALAFPGVRVTLHRVGPDHAAPIDSMRSDAAGRYAFSYRRTGDTTALYFVSATRAGIAYFTSPLRQPRVEGEAAELMLFDTTSAPVPIHVRGRHVVVAAADSDGTRQVVEVFEIANDSNVTRIAAGGAGGAGGAGETFETPMPRGATAFAAGDGEIAAQAFAVVGERVRIVAPLAPGVKQFSFNYRLPAGEREVLFAVPQATDVLEVLLEDPGATVRGEGLKAVAQATTSGRVFRRYLGHDVVAGARVSVALPSTSIAGRQLRLALAVIAIGAVMLVGFARAFRRPSPAVAPNLVASVAAADAIAAIERELVELDDTFARTSRPSVEQRGEHLAARARVKARLAAAVAARDGIS